MALSNFWKKFIKEYAADGIYWYFPKGGTADTEMFRKKFRVFQSFEGQDWTPKLQGKFLAVLRNAKLSDGKTRALTRITKRVYENLGLCLVKTGRPIRITPAGRQYLKETGPSKVLDAHIWRYQFPNRLNDVTSTKGISLFPHLVVVEMLLACGRYITTEEYVLFVARMKRSSEMKKGIERIKAWRSALGSTRGEIIKRLAKTRHKTVDEDSGFFLAFHRCDLLLDRHTDRLSVSRGNARTLAEMLKMHKRMAVHIDFKDKSDAIAFYSDPNRASTKLEALDYYIDVSDVEKAIETYKKLPKDVRGGQTPEEFKKEQFLEKHLEAYLEKHLEKIEPGLKWLGRQYSTEVGRIDLYARAKNGDLVVIELKKGRAADNVFGQICRYMGCIKMRRPKTAKKMVRGYIIGRAIDINLHYAARVLKSGVIGLQVFEFKEEKGKEDWIRIAGA